MSKCTVKYKMKITTKLFEKKLEQKGFKGASAPLKTQMSRRTQREKKFFVLLVSSCLCGEIFDSVQLRNGGKKWLLVKHWE